MRYPAAPVGRVARRDVDVNVVNVSEAKLKKPTPPARQLAEVALTTPHLEQDDPAKVLLGRWVGNPSGRVGAAPRMHE